MFFIGQEHIMYQLGDLLTYTYEKKSGLNLLFRGASGYGKTELAKKSCNFLVGDQYQYCLGKNISFDRNVWVHFIDEIHLMEKPEILYPIMDLNKYVFIFATNFDSLLPEALTNRCKNQIFTEYSDKELEDIFRFHAKLEFDSEVIKHIIAVSNRNPRIMIQTFLNNIEVHYTNHKDEYAHSSPEQMIQTIDRIHGIVGELDVSARHYLEVLQNLGGRASVNLLASSSKLDLNTIKYTVEPALLYKKLIRITSRGRELINGN